MNRKGEIFGVNFVLAVFLIFVGIIFFMGGGAVTIFKISAFMTSVPTPVWIFLGIIVLFSLIRGKR